MTDVSNAQEQNVRDLARVMSSEAGGAPGEAAQIAVGWCLRNRMIRNGATDVRRVWAPAFTHRAAATATTLRDARGILDGSIADPTGGATHFYTPAAMAKEGESTDGQDVGGGLEQVPGVTRGGAPIRNYAPSFANSPDFVPATVPGVRPATFKFYRKLGTGHVR